ncbi:MAG: hypothetical protein HY898_10205 [Deltaproteobacteria bacterium]|nr:hypothetical protein [Deltaproteobacteria bacterium]
MTTWKSQLNHDPVQPLLRGGFAAISLFARRDLLSEPAGAIEQLWDLPEVLRIVRKQRPDGSWKPAAGKQDKCPGVKYPLIETWRNLRHLVDQYELDHRHPAVHKACEYVLSCQTAEGDIRGILANQYAPYYTGALLYLLIKAGYGDDPRIERGMRWLLEVRQADGGWVIGSPGMLGLGKLSAREMNDLTSNGKRETAKAFDPSQPFSAAGTGMALRAFAISPRYRKSPQASAAARLLKSKLLREDNWSSYQHPDNWVRFQFPFWWTQLVSALDTLSLMGWSAQDSDVRRGVDWLVAHQQPDGLWKTSYSRIHKSSGGAEKVELRQWITLAICRVLRRLSASDGAGTSAGAPPQPL